MKIQLYISSYNEERIEAVALAFKGQEHFSADVRSFRWTPNKLQVCVSGTTLNENNKDLIETIECNVYADKVRIVELELEPSSIDEVKFGISSIYFDDERIGNEHTGKKY